MKFITHYTINTKNKFRKELKPLSAKTIEALPLERMAFYEERTFWIPKTNFTAKALYVHGGAIIEIYKKGKLVTLNSLFVDPRELDGANELYRYLGMPEIVMENIKKDEIPLLATYLDEEVLSLGVDEIMQVADLEFCIAQRICELYFKDAKFEMNDSKEEK